MLTAEDFVVEAGPLLAGAICGLISQGIFPCHFQEFLDTGLLKF